MPDVAYCQNFLGLGKAPPRALEHPIAFHEPWGFMRRTQNMAA
jgi:hypothetical protein